MKKSKWKKAGLTLFASSALILAACSPPSTGNGNEEQIVEGGEIELTYVAWDEVLASNNVLATVFEDLGYDVTLTHVDNAIMWESVASGEADASLAAVLPDTHAPMYEEHQDDIELAGTNLEGARNAITVPAYMEVDSLDELTDEADQTITGIEPGSGVMNMAEEALETYPNLEDWTLNSSSTGAMVSELESALASEEEVIVTSWIPHWMFIEHDLKILEDPEGVMGGENAHNTMVRQGLQEDDPVAYSILENFEWTIDDVNSVMIEMSEGVAPEDAARNWVDENQDVVDEWTAEAKEIAQENN